MSSLTIKAINGGEEYNLVIGGEVDFYNKDVNHKWTLYNDKWNLYNDNLKGDKADKADGRLIDLINDILELPEYIDDPYLLLEICNEIKKSSTYTLFHTFIKRLKLEDSLNAAKKTLFWKWKELIEASIISFLKKKDEKIMEAVNQWKLHIENNNINTSSIILWALFSKQSPFYKNYLENIDFEYKGFCPKEPDLRIKYLMQFPLNDVEFTFKEDIEVFELPVFKEINSLSKTNSPLLEKVTSNSFTVNSFTSNSTLELYEFMNTWIAFFNKSHPLLKKYEEYCIDASSKINKTSDDIQQEINFISTYIVQD